MSDIEAKDVLDFWLAAGPEKWFSKDDQFDAELSRRFSDSLEAAKGGDCDHWAETPQGSLGLIILFDQFSRNIHRGSHKAFEADEKARQLARDLVARGVDMEMPQALRKWVYLPYEHSEDLQDQDTCIELMKRTGSDDDVKWAEMHADIIRRFGRFPHRNKALGRASSPAELAFLDDGGFAG